MTTMERIALISYVISETRRLQDSIDNNNGLWYFEAAIQNLESIKDRLQKEWKEIQ